METKNNKQHVCRGGGLSHDSVWKRQLDHIARLSSQVLIVLTRMRLVRQVSQSGVLSCGTFQLLPIFCFSSQTSSVLLESSRLEIKHNLGSISEIEDLSLRIEKERLGLVKSELEKMRVGSFDLLTWSHDVTMATKKGLQPTLKKSLHEIFTEDATL